MLDEWTSGTQRRRPVSALHALDHSNSARINQSNDQASTGLGAANRKKANVVRFQLVLSEIQKLRRSQDSLPLKICNSLELILMMSSITLADNEPCLCCDPDPGSCDVRTSGEITQ